MFSLRLDVSRLSMRKGEEVLVMMRRDSGLLIREEEEVFSSWRFSGKLSWSFNSFCLLVHMDSCSEDLDWSCLILFMLVFVWILGLVLN